MIVSYIRTIVVYFSLIAVVRLMGKRQVGEMEPSELVVAMLIADLAAIPMQDTGISIFGGLIPIFTVLGIEVILSALTFRFIPIRKLLCGKPVILMENGRILYPNLKKTRVSVNELIEHLRESGILDPATVKYAVLETNGQISIIPYPKFEPACAKDAGVKVDDVELPVMVICDGRWQEDNLKLTGKTKTWILEQLRHHNCSVEDVLILSVVSGGVFYFSRKEPQKK